MCWVPFYVWGSPCLSSKSLAGNPYTYIDYYVQVMTPGYTVHCYAYAMAYYAPGAICSLGWQKLGKVGNTMAIYRLIWGDIAATPAI